MRWHKRISLSAAAEQLEALQKRIVGYNASDMPGDYLAFARVGDGFCVDFYGSCFEEGYLDLLNTLALPAMAPYIRSLLLRGPDEGANGTHPWDLEPLLATDVSFSCLRTFLIQLNQPTDHNRSILGSDHEEAGCLARLLAKSPKMLEMTIPSAPDAAFFGVAERPLRFLSVDAGYDTQGFIGNLARSDCFPSLQCLEWGEYNETYMEDYSTRCTPMADYRELFSSKAFSRVGRFVWRNPHFSDEAIKALKQRKPDVSLLVVRSASAYV